MLPDREEQDSRQQLDHEIAKRDWLLAPLALPPQPQPGDQWDIVSHRDLRLAIRTERALRFVHAQPIRNPVDHHVQKRPNARPDRKRESR